MTDEFATWRKKLHGTPAATLSGRQRWTNDFGQISSERIHFFPPNPCDEKHTDQNWDKADPASCNRILRSFFLQFSRNWFVKNIYMSKHKKKELDEMRPTKQKVHFAPPQQVIFGPPPPVESTCRFSATQNKTPRRHVRYQEKLNKRDPPERNEIECVLLCECVRCEIMRRGVGFGGKRGELWKERAHHRK